MITLNVCDFGHKTAEKTKLLPISKGGSNLIICEKCFNLEMRSRRIQAKQYGSENFEFPEWKDLKIYETS